MALGLNNLVRFVVNGTCAGQRINNVLWYWIYNFSGGDTLTQLLTEFRSQWRTSILPLLDDDYTVLSYEARIFGRMIAIPEIPSTIPGVLGRPARYRIRWGDLLSLAGVGGTDVGGDAGDSMPTLVAIGVRKVVEPGGRFYPWNGSYTLSAKGLRGSVRFSPVALDRTDPLTPNNLTAGTITAYNAAVEAIRQFPFGAAAGSNAGMIVVSFMQDGGFWSSNLPGGVAAPIFALVNSVVTNPKITSQVSRKERV